MDFFRSAKYYYLRSLRILKRKGSRGLLCAVLKKLKHLLWVTNSADWYCRDLENATFDIQARKPVQIIFHFNSEITTWLKEHHCLFPWMYIPEEIKTAKSEGHIFPYLKHNDEIIGYVKIGLGKVYILDYDKIIEFPEKHSFIYDTFIMPKFRGLNFAPFLLNEAIKYLKSLGFEKIWCHIPSWNTSSRRAFEKLNFHRSTRVRYLRLLNLRFFTNNPKKLLSK